MEQPQTASAVSTAAAAAPSAAAASSAAEAAAAGAMKGREKQVMPRRFHPDWYFQHNNEVGQGI